MTPATFAERRLAAHEEHETLLAPIPAAPYPRRTQLVRMHALDLDGPLCRSHGLGTPGRTVVASTIGAIDCGNCRRVLRARLLSRVVSDADAFRAYFDVADELGGGLTIDELDRSFVLDALVASRRLGLPWEPELAVAEEYALDHRELVA